jgi:hypothetical protein
MFHFAPNTGMYFPLFAAWIPAGTTQGVTPDFPLSSIVRRSAKPTHHQTEHFAPQVNRLDP